MYKCSRSQTAHPLHFNIFYFAYSTVLRVRFGAVKAFEEKNIKFNYISGTSSGSIITILYALEYSSDEMLELLKHFSKKLKYVEYSKIIKFVFDFFVYGKIKVDGLNSGNKLEKIIKIICEKNK